MKIKRLLVILVIVFILLLIPVIAMQFTDEVNWGLMDFIMAGAILIGAVVSFDFVLRKVRPSRNQIALCLVLLLVIVLMWIELAVGIFGTPFAGS